RASHGRRCRLTSRRGTVREVRRRDVREQTREVANVFCWLVAVAILRNSFRGFYEILAHDFESAVESSRNRIFYLLASRGRRRTHPDPGKGGDRDEYSCISHRFSFEVRVSDPYSAAIGCRTSDSGDGIRPSIFCIPPGLSQARLHRSGVLRIRLERR